MRRPTNMYIDLWLEQAERQIKHIPGDRAQVSLDDWIAILAEIREHRDRESNVGHMQRIGALADALPTDEAMERRADAALARARANHKPRKLTMPALTEDEREALRFARERVSFNLNASAASEYFSEGYIDRHNHALSVLDRLLATKEDK